MKTALLYVLLMAPALSAGAIELSLEENRAERGNIGYIDMKRLFVLFPETQRAREGFEDSVRQAEEQLNVRKAELIRLRSELGKLKTERAVLAVVPVPEPPKPAPAPISPAAANPQLDALLASTFTLPGFLSNASTAAVVVSTAIMPAPVGRLLTDPRGGTSAPYGAVGRSLTDSGGGTSAPYGAVVAVSTPVLTADLKAPATAQAAAPAPPSALQELDERIARKAKELSRKEADFREYQASTEKSLLDLENRKSEILLGKIHKAVQEVARKEGVSVVVDKGSILYGHNAVDLTEKVLRHLKGT